MVTKIDFFVMLVRQLEAMTHSAKGFDATAWMTRWVNEPVPALGGARPIDLMNNPEGQALVSKTLAQIWSGAYA